MLATWREEPDTDCGLGADEAVRLLHARADSEGRPAKTALVPPGPAESEPPPPTGLTAAPMGPGSRSSAPSVYSLQKPSDGTGKCAPRQGAHRAGRRLDRAIGGAATPYGYSLLSGHLGGWGSKSGGWGAGIRR
jgi:hypothetical protein